MRMATAFAVLGVFALAACELEPPPPDRPGWGGRPPHHGQVNIERAERACVAQAQRQGLRVRRIVQTDIVTDRRGRVIGTHTILRVSRGGRIYPVRCNYTFDTRTARITSLRPA